MELPARDDAAYLEALRKKAVKFAIHRRQHNLADDFGQIVMMMHWTGAWHTWENALRQLIRTNHGRKLRGKKHGEFKTPKREETLNYIELDSKEARMVRLDSVPDDSVLIRKLFKGDELKMMILKHEMGFTDQEIGNLFGLHRASIQERFMTLYKKLRQKIHSENLRWK